jgi:hypothetical protein
MSFKRTLRLLGKPLNIIPGYGTRLHGFFPVKSVTTFNIGILKFTL